MCPGPRDLQAVFHRSAVLAALVLGARFFSLVTEVEIVNARACPPCLFGGRPDSDIQGYIHNVSATNFESLE